MKRWWQKKKTKTRRSKKNHDTYTAWDVILDILIWLPELILFPFRVIFWLARGIGKLIGNIFDFV